MFKLAACFWTALALTLPSRAEDTCHSDVESWSTLRCPVQYFAVESQNSRYWTTLFPDNPPFAYACLYLPSFDREFGFYLDGNELCWARAIGPCSMQMLSQFPVADFRSSRDETGCRAADLLALSRFRESFGGMGLCCRYR